MCRFPCHRHCVEVDLKRINNVQGIIQTASKKKKKKHHLMQIPILFCTYTGSKWNCTVNAEAWCNSFSPAPNSFRHHWTVLSVCTWLRVGDRISFRQTGFWGRKRMHTDEGREVTTTHSLQLFPHVTFREISPNFFFLIFCEFLPTSWASANITNSRMF